MASRDTEKLASIIKPPYKMLVETFTGPTAYHTGGNVLQSRLLKVLERATCLQATGGFVGEVVTGSVVSYSVSAGNQFQLKVWTGAPTGAFQPASGADLSGQAFSVLVEGFG